MEPTNTKPKFLIPTETQFLINVIINKSKSTSKLQTKALEQTFILFGSDLSYCYIIYVNFSGVRKFYLGHYVRESVS